MLLTYVVQVDEIVLLKVRLRRHRRFLHTSVQCAHCAVQWHLNHHGKMSVRKAICIIVHINWLLTCCFSYLIKEVSSRLNECSVYKWVFLCVRFSHCWSTCRTKVSLVTSMYCDLLLSAKSSLWIHTFHPQFVDWQCQITLYWRRKRILIFFVFLNQRTEKNELATIFDHIKKVIE